MISTNATSDYHAALLRDAANGLVDASAPYRVLPREKLAALAGANRWRTITLDDALQWAIAHGILHQLDTDLYEIPPTSPAGPTS
jgi:hypothetical protein